MAHHCKYFIAHCIDFRLQKSIKDYLELQGLLGNCDIVSVAGGVKNRDFLSGQLDISVNLHKVQEVMLINHTDCGAYGGSGKFSSFEEECAFHIEELKKAKFLILAKYPSLNVRNMLAKIPLSGEISFEEVNARNKAKKQ